MKTGEELKIALGKSIKSRRNIKKWSQEKLGFMVDVSRNTICEIENGNSFPAADTLVKLARAFETNVYELFKPKGILPDKQADILIEYTAEVREKVEEIGNFYLGKIK